MKGLYIHIPFCNTICTYCDFPKRIAKDIVKEEYINNLLIELEEYKVKLNNISTVYIGGGTPNSLKISTLERLLKALKPYLDKSIENTIEVNPELINEQQAILFKKYNINRISIGVQTFNDSLLSVINRHHTKNDVKNAINILKSNGIDNINIDMMYGLPGQTISNLKDDVDLCLSLDIKHISYYCLIFEEKTILEYQVKHNQITLPDDDLTADMADYLSQLMSNSKFKRYEISNYAISGYESKHNLLYWNCEEYVGIGASACGYLNNIRYKNHDVLAKYYLKHIETEEIIDIEEAKREFMMLGLRKTEGIDINDYYKKFNSYPNIDFDIDKLLKLGFIVLKNNIIKIKEDKINIANIVFEEFVR